ICASGCGKFTTNLRIQEGKRGKRNEKKLDVKRSEVRVVRPAVYCGAWLCCYEPVEFADAACVRLASDHLLAGGGPLASEQDPLRRISWGTGQAHVLASPHERTLGAHDP